MVHSPHNLYEIDMQTMSGEFLECWKAAGIHLNNQVDGGLGWLRADPKPPFLEHLSFLPVSPWQHQQSFFIRASCSDLSV